MGLVCLLLLLGSNAALRQLEVVVGIGPIMIGILPKGGVAHLCLFSSAYHRASGGSLCVTRSVNDFLVGRLVVP